MAFSFDVASNIPRLNQSGTDTGLAGIATAIASVATVARSTAYTTAMLRKPITPTGFWYRCSTAGTTAATAPTFGTTDGGTTTDGTAIFTAFKAPDVQTLGTTNHYYMPAIRMAINGTLTNTNPQQQNFTCLDLIIFTGNFTSGAWASDGLTPLWDGLHFASVRSSTSGADGVGMALQSGGQFTFIGGEVQTANGVTFENNTTPRSYLTRWRNTKEYGASSARFRSYTTNAIFQNVETYDFAFDLFRMPTVAPSIKARGSEYVYQYVGASAGGADAKFSASSLENVNGTYDFDNYFGGWIELFNCAKGANLNVVSQFPNSSVWVKHLVPLFQDIRITAKDTSGNLLQNVRFNCTDSPTNSPTVTFTTASNLKTWDFRNPFSYETTTNASGIALSSPCLQAWYWQTSFKQNLRFPLSTATYQGRAYNFKTMSVSVVLGSNSIQDVSAGMVTLDTATTVDENTASAITGISIVPSGANGGTITISSNKSYQDIWNYYRWWISQYANRPSNDTWTCTGGKLDSKLFTLVVNSGVTLTGTAEITQYKTTGTVTNNGSITAIYESSLGESTIWEFGSTAEPILAGTSLAIYDASGVTKYFNAVSADGVYKYYIEPQAVGVTYTYAIEKYGTRRESGTFQSNAGGILFYVPSYGEDVGITQATLATVQAYTTLSDTAQIYDATANFRLSETGIKLGQLVSRDGTFLDFGNFNVKIKDDASAIVAVSSGLITYKSIVINESVKYNAMKATPPKTITPNDNEQINVLIEDANGDSQLSILGGDNLGYELWKITTATATDDYATGTLLTTLSTNAEVFRFIGISGFDIVGRDVSSGVRRRSSMIKGEYSQAFYVGNQIQLSTDAPQLIENNQKLDELILKVDTKLDVAVSTRLAEIDYVEPHNTEIDAIKLKVDTLENTDLTGIATNSNVTDAKDEIIAEIGNIDVDLTGIALETTSQSIKTKVDTLENYNDTGTQNKLDSIQSTVDNIDVDFTPVLDAVATKPTLIEIEGSTILAKKTDIENAKDSIQTKIDAIPETDLTGIATSSEVQDVKDVVDLSLKAEDYTAPDNTKISQIKTKVDTLQNADLSGIATKTDVATAKTEILEAVNDIEIDNEAIATEVWNKEPERLKQVATVETTGEQIASFNNL